MQNFPHRLAQAITASEKPKGGLAEHAGVALSTVSRWLAGTVPKAETLTLISEYLGVDAKWLLTGTGPSFSEARDSKYDPCVASGQSSAPLSAASAPPRFNPPPPPATDPILLAVLERIATALEKFHTAQE